MAQTGHPSAASNFLETPGSRLRSIQTSSRQGFDEADQANAAAGDGRERKFVSWRDLERVADEAADIDAVVRSELQAVAERGAVEVEPFARSVHSPRRRGLPGGAFVAGDVVHLADEPRRADDAAALRLAAGRGSEGDRGPTLLLSTVLGGRPRGRTTGVRRNDHRRLTEDPSGATLLLTLGNAGGVDLLVNSRRVSTGAAGAVVHLSFALEDGKVTQLTS